MIFEEKFEKMSTGKRLAKRSIIGTRVCAQGADHLWYSGIIQAVKTPASLRDNNNCINLTPDTKYSVRFDSKQDMTGLGYGAGQTRRFVKEYRETELIGPGFQSIINVHLRPTQKIYLTYNGRESAGEVMSHDLDKDEVTVKMPANGHEPSFELKKKLEEVRLLESRRSARLADQDRDTDFARLADMGGDRRRASHSIDVPLVLTQQGSRKRRPSYSNDTDMYHHSIHHNDDLMDECNAALVLMSLSCSPLSPRQYATTRLASSPGGSSASSWCSGSSSPPLSDEGAPQMNTSSTSPNRVRTTSLSTSDEGIGMDYNEDTPRKRRANGRMLKCTWKGCRVVHTTVNQIETHVRNAHLGPKKPRGDENEDSFIDSDHEEEFYYTEVEDDDQDESSPSPPSPPTLSHRDMARPPHEDPEYQRQLVGSFRQGLLSLATQKPVKPPLPMSIGGTVIPTSPIAHHNYTWAHQNPMSPQKHVRLSPRPSTSYAPYPSPTYTNAIAAAQHNVHIALGTTPNNLHNGHQMNAGGPLNLSHSAPNHHHQHLHQHLQQNRSPVSPNRRTRGENKKCRKVYGMDNKEAWCTQCKWKKACSRFGD